MTAALDQLVRLLDLEQIDLATFRGDSPETTLQRVYGGQVAGQALVAAGRTVPPERPVHSLHAYFLRPGEPGTPVLYHVDRIRDGRSFTTRRVVAIQNGRAIFNLAASFHAAEQGVEHQVDMPAVPPPDALPTWHERLEPWADQLGAFYRRPRPIDVRYVSDPPWAVRDGSPRAPRSLVWLRADGRLPDDPLVHVCALTYASDMTLLDAVLRVHGLAWGDGRVSGASLDHAMWFHRPFRADEWLLYETEAPSSSAGRGLAQGRLFRRDGGLAVSVVQEGLLRVR
ncbi:MAG TPA: acyl-CoA thioesterase II, partial [Mycobacteriales bacterium]|nr:acyl-CoA thioesterase II [Mycobacteriales bacterium]